MKQPVSPVVLLAPMECEYRLLADALQNARVEEIGNFLLTAGEVYGIPVIAVRTLVGTINAATAAMLCIERFSPRCVILAGTSGAHDPALHRGDMILGEHFVEIGSYLAPHGDRGAGCFPEHWELPGVEMKTAQGVAQVKFLHADEALLTLAETLRNPHGILRRGTIGSGDTWNRELDRIAWLREHLGTDCEEMEGFGVAQVCTARGVPMLGVRIISNSEWHEGESFDPATGEWVQEFCLTLLQAISKQ